MPSRRQHSAVPALATDSVSAKPLIHSDWPKQLTALDPAWARLAPGRASVRDASQGHPEYTPPLVVCQAHSRQAVCSSAMAARAARSLNAEPPSHLLANSVCKGGTARHLSV